VFKDAPGFLLALHVIAGESFHASGSNNDYQ
jgi:hypothetical protein